MLIDIKIIVNNLLSSEIINDTTMPEKITSLDQVRTMPFDPRFPNQNQTRNCYQNFLDYHRCVKLHGEKFPACQSFKKAFTGLCPSEWTEKWTEEIAEGRFPGVI